MKTKKDVYARMRSLTTKDGDSIDAEICYADNCEEGSVQASIGYTKNKGK